MEDLAFLETVEHIEQASDRKQAAFALCSLYPQVSEEQRQLLRSSWFTNQVWILPRVQTLLLPDPYPGEQRVRASLIVVSLYPEPDWRDDLITLSLLYHCATRLHLNAAALFEEIAEVSTPDMADLMRGFAHRSVAEQAIAAFGWREEQTPEGIGLVSLDPPTSAEQQIAMMEAFFRRPATAAERAEIVSAKQAQQNRDRYTEVKFPPRTH